MASPQNGNRYSYAEYHRYWSPRPHDSGPNLSPGPHRYQETSQAPRCKPPNLPRGLSNRAENMTCSATAVDSIRCDNSPGSCRNCDVYRSACSITLPDGSVVSRSIGRPSQSHGSDHRRSPKTLNHHSSIVQQRLPVAKAKDAIGNNESETPAFAARESQEHDGDASFVSPSNVTVTSTRSDALEGVVVIEAGRFPQKNKFSGMSSGQVLAKSAEELFKDNVSGIDVMKFFCPLMNLAEEIPLPSLFLQPLVDKNTADGQIDVFFSTIHDLFPIFDEMDFRRKYEAFYSEGFTTDPGTAVCIYMAIALGGDNSASSKEVRATHFQATWSLNDSLIACPYLPSVQALILLTLHLMSAHRDGQAILIIGTAIRIAQSLGLHRKLAVRIHPHEKEFIGQNYYRRSCVWWVCYCLDKKLCLEGGRPSIINDDDCDVDLPEVAISPGSLSQPGQSIESGSLGHFISLCRILSNISSRLFGRAVSQNSEDAILQQVEAIDQALLHFGSSLPFGLQPDQDLAGLGIMHNLVGANLLHCVYHNAMLTIHRAALLGSVPPEMRLHRNPRIVTSESICLGAARSLARSVNELVHSSSAWMIPRLTLSYALNTVFALYIGIMKSPQRWSCDSDLALVKSMRGCLFKIELFPNTLHDFDVLLASLCRAVENAQRRSGLQDTQDSMTPRVLSRGSELALGNLGGRAEQPSGDMPDMQPITDGQGGSGDIDLRFIDFFGDDFGPMNFQFWPTD